MIRRLKSMRLLASTLSIAFLSSNACDAAEWVQNKLIDRIQVTPTGNIVVYITADNSCGSTRLEYVSAYSESTDGEKYRAVRSMVYAGLLAAQAQNKTLHFYVTGCVSTVATFDRTEG